MKRKISVYFGLVLVLALSMGLTMGLLNHNAGPDTAEAVREPFLGFAFGVGQTNTLQSFDQDDNGRIDNTTTGAAAEEQFSGYEFTVKSNADFVAGDTMIITFVCPTSPCDTVEGGDGDGVEAVGLAGVMTGFGAKILIGNDDSEIAEVIATGVEAVTLFPTLKLEAPVGMDTVDDGDNINVTIPAGLILNPSVADEDYAIKVEIINVDVDDVDEGPDTSKDYSFGPRFSASPDDPGASSRITFNFFVQNALVANDGRLRFTFDKDWKNIPTTMSASTITIRADRVLDAALELCAPAGQGACSPNQVTNPFLDPSFDLVGSEHKDVEITIQIADMDPSTSDTTGVGNQNIASGALVTVSFSNAAGITIPSEGNTAFQAHGSGTDEIDLDHTDANGHFPGVTVGEAEPRIPRVLELDSDDGTLGETVTLVGKGFKNGTSITLFVDTNGDGVRQSNESELLTGVPVLKDDTFTADFTVTSAIVAGGGDNNLQVVDGEGNGACLLTTGSAGRCDGAPNAADFALKGRVEVSPSTAGRGDTITITLEDWAVDNADNANVLSAAIGGAALDPADFAGALGLIQDNEVTWTTTVPNNAPLGNSLLIVATEEGENGDTGFAVTGATLNLALTEAVPNQSLTFNGTGFSDTGTVVICESNITIADNREVEFDPDETTRVLGVAVGSCNAGERVIDVTSGGTFVATVTIPVNSQTLRDGVTHEVKVTDSSGREGTEKLLFPARTMVVNPLECGTRCLIEVTGTGFPADNDDGVSVNITVEYDCGENCRDTDNVDPDTSGRFTAQLEVPSRAPIPSDNTISAAIFAPDKQTPRPTVKHFIPEAQVELSIAKGPSGTLVDVTGRFFSAFTAVERLEFGGLNGLGNRSPNTDSSGGFSLEGVLVPDLDEGMHSVIARVGAGDREVTANTVYEVTTRGLFGVPTTAAEALAPLTDDNLLERAFFFDNSTKLWSFYDPRPEFVDANTIDEFFSGGVYWIKVTADTEPILNGQTRNLVCVNVGMPEEDCWSLLVW